MIIDIIVIAFIVLGAYAGYKKGLIGILVSFVGLILSIVLALLLQSSVANFIYQETGFGTSLEQAIETKLLESFEEQNDSEEGNDIYYNLIKNATSEEQIHEISTQVTQFILKGVSFIGIFLIVFIICYIAQMILNIVFDLPILSQLNSIGGVALGIIKVLLKLWIVLAVISFIAPLPMFSFLDSFIKDTTLTNILYDHNILVTIIKAGLGLQ